MPRLARPSLRYVWRWAVCVAVWGLMRVDIIYSKKPPSNLTIYQVTSDREKSAAVAVVFLGAAPLGATNPPRSFLYAVCGGCC